MTKIALVLGSGAARGWAHIGVLRALDEIGLEPDLYCGASIGAVVCAGHLAGTLDSLCDWARGFTPNRLMQFWDIFLPGNAVASGEQLFRRLEGIDPEANLEDLPKPLAVVATDLVRGRDVVLRSGNLSSALRASTAMPGVFEPVLRDGIWLVDGSVTNPVPTSMALALGADAVIAVDVNSNQLQASKLARDRKALPQARHPVAKFLFGGGDRPLPEARKPRMIETMIGAVDIMQDYITRSRLAGMPPDVLIAPPVGPIGILDFHRAEEGIAAGYDEAMAMRSALERLLR